MSRFAGLAVAVLLGTPLITALPAHAADDVTINLIGFNDFHGRLDTNTVKFAGTVEQVRQAGGSANSLLISAGDNVSASLYASAVQRDIPTIDVLNALDLDASAAGNHELDWGAADLTGRLSSAATFPFLSASVFKADGSPLLKKYKIFTISGVDVAVVAAVTDTTPQLVYPSGIVGLTFRDPTASINAAVQELKRLPDPPDVIVASIHEGAWSGTGALAEVVAASPAFKKIVEETDPAVDAIFMGHTHQAYAFDAPIPGEPGRTRPVLQTGSFGSNVGNIKLTFDKGTGNVTAYTRSNVARTKTADADLVAAFPRVAAVKTIVDSAIAYSLKTATTLSSAGVTTTSYGKLTRIAVKPSSGGGSATLWGASSAPLSSVIGADGWAWFTLPRTLAVGAHTLTLSYGGDSTYRASTKTHALLVTKAGSRVTGSITKRATKSKSGVIAVKAVSVNGGATPTGSVRAYFIRSGYRTRTTTARNLIGGWTNLTIAALPKGTWTIRLKYAGSTTLLPSTVMYRFKITN